MNGHRSPLRSWIEAITLVTLLLTPLFFNPLSMQAFEPAKATWLQAVGLLLTAWLIMEGLVHRKQVFSRTIFRRPLMVPVVCYGGWLTLSSVCSIHPAVSFWGSYQRAFGLTTQLTPILLFASVCLTTRTHMRRERLIHLLVATSVPVSLYALMQRFGMDPLPLSRDITQRVTSTLGGPVFLAGYLAMVVPLTLRQLFRCASRSSSSRWLGVLWSSLTLGVQLAAIVATGSRGPVVGLLVGLAGCSVLYLKAYQPRHCRALSWALFLSCVGLAILVGHSLSPQKTGEPKLGRFTQSLQEDHSTSQSRLIIWNASQQAFTARQPMQTAPHQYDSLHKLRWLVGYGPDTGRYVYAQRCTPELARQHAEDGLTDRAHNQIWQSLLSGGIGGLVFWFFLTLSLFLLSLQRIGLQGRTYRRTALPPSPAWQEPA